MYNIENNKYFDKWLNSPKVLGYKKMYTNSKINDYSFIKDNY